MRNHGPILRILAPALLVLGVCVFAWGLKYKLSLYDPPRAVSHRMPAAKLLSGNERRTFTVVDRHTVTDTSALAFFTALIFAAFAFKGHLRHPGFSRLMFSPGRSRVVPACAPCAGFFIRPPPRVR